MLKENLIMLRKINGFSQEDIAGRIEISRQAYGKWESGETTPDIEKCARLAAIYGVTLDSLVHEQSIGDKSLPPPPKGKHIFGTAIISERGQIVIPKETREMFGLTAGSKLVILGDENEGIALIRADRFEQRIRYVLEQAET